MISNKNYICEYLLKNGEKCNKSYKYRSGLCKHVHYELILKHVNRYNLDQNITRENIYSILNRA